LAMRFCAEEITAQSRSTGIKFDRIVVPKQDSHDATVEKARATSSLPFTVFNSWTTSEPGLRFKCNPTQMLSSGPPSYDAMSRRRLVCSPKNPVKAIDRRSTEPAFSNSLLVSSGGVAPLLLSAKPHQRCSN
jgi:hypothetical protein